LISEIAYFCIKIKEMKIFTSQQIREADAYTIQNEPIAGIDLMERAANQLTNWFCNKFYPDTPVSIFVGPGNNGGDGLVMARLLSNKNYSVRTFYIKFTDKVSDDFRINLDRLSKQNKSKLIEIKDPNDLPEFDANEILIDGIFGSGLTRPLKGLPAEIVQRINSLHKNVVSIDIPSGLFGEDNSNNNYKNIIRAAHTISFQFPKLSFFLAENEDFYGELVVLPIGLHPEYIKTTHTPYSFMAKNFITKKIIQRKKHSHKGTFGHALLIAGSFGKFGAAVLAAKACLRSGAGLLTAHLPRKGNDIMQIAVPECMTSIDEDDKIFSDDPPLEKYDAVAIGPGLGTSKASKHALRNILENVDVPLVIDADALNIISANKSFLGLIPENSILTPHPKEFERLTENTESHFERLKLLQNTAKKIKSVIILKGANTCIALPNGNCFFNTTGNAGMATAGSGDVLTGILLGLIAQGYSAEDASCIGVYLHGLAGDIALKNQSQESLIADDIIINLGHGFKEIYNERI
jgi:NAD(P)H-hydrate epimerase